MIAIFIFMKFIFILFKTSFRGNYSTLTFNFFNFYEDNLREFNITDKINKLFQKQFLNDIDG